MLDDPIKEINTRTPYIVRYETIKDGRKVVAFEFTMDTYNVPKDNEDISKFKRDSNAIQTLCSLGFTERVACAIFSKCLDEADCFSRINRAQSLLFRSNKPIKNKLGFLRKAIEADWQIGRENKRRIEQSATQQTKSQKQARISNSMTSVGEIFKSIFSSPIEDSTPEKPQSINIGKKQISRSLAETFMNYIRKGEMLEKVKEYLMIYNTTIEKFIEICKKNGI